MSISSIPSTTRALAVALLLTGALTLAACGGGGGGGGNAGTPGPVTATITMAYSDFAGTGTATTPSVTIKAGEAVAFVDPTSGGGTHNLVTGSQGQFSAEAGAPAAFTSSGIMFRPGDTKDITFPTAGTYHITCTIHFYMSATVTVTT
jgi:plastocyanin